MEAGKVWEFVNPLLTQQELKELTKPEVPRAKDINPEKTTVAELLDIELDALKLLRYNFKHKLQLFKQQDTALSTLKSFIQETISWMFLPYTFKKELMYDILVVL